MTSKYAYNQVKFLWLKKRLNIYKHTHFFCSLHFVFLDIGGGELLAYLLQEILILLICLIEAG